MIALAILRRIAFAAVLAVAAALHFPAAGDRPDVRLSAGDTPVIDHVIDFIESRTWRLALLPTLTAGVAWAAHTDPQFPQEGQRWFLSVRAPDTPGRARFARVYGEPLDGRWAVTVTCGTASLRTGHERVELQATGMAARSRHGDLGWTWTPVGGGPAGGGGITRENALSPDVVMAAPCPSGVGDLSSGD